MNGWQRMWVVVSLVLAILISWFTYLMLPTESRVTYNHESSINQLTGYLKNAEGSKYQTDYVASLREDIRKENEDFKKELSEIPKERTSYITDSIKIWLGLSASLYAIGWLIGWIYRGFRPKKT